MPDRLFVYGTLAPGKPNEHILANIGGTFEPASVKGKLHQQGWGAALGYPGIELDERGGDVEGFLFSSENLSQHWKSLDDFEGEGYQRRLAEVTLKDGTTLAAYVYAINLQEKLRRANPE